jgi:hypothetical protein
MAPTLTKVPGSVELAILHARLASIQVQALATPVLMVCITRQTIDA